MIWLLWLWNMVSVSSIFTISNVRGLACPTRTSLILTPDEWKVFYRDAIAAKRTVKNLDISLDDPIIALLDARDAGSLVKGSVCGKLSLNIKANGDMTPCGFIPIVIGNIVQR